MKHLGRFNSQYGNKHGSISRWNYELW